MTDLVSELLLISFKVPRAMEGDLGAEGEVGEVIYSHFQPKIWGFFGDFCQFFVHVRHACVLKLNYTYSRHWATSVGV